MKLVGLLLIIAPLFATTNITSVEPTQEQAIIRYTTDQAGNCTIRASVGTSFTTNIPDLTDNGNTDARAGSIIDGAKHVFVLGTRKGSDGLGNGLTYHVGVTCGTDPEQVQNVTVLPIPYGATNPTTVPFNSAQWGNRDYPTIDYANPSIPAIDPVEGVQVYPVTRPGFVQGNIVLAASASSYLGVPLDASGTAKWATIANITSNGVSFSNGTGGSTDKAFIPIASGVNCVGGNSSFPMGGWGTTGCTLDDISFDVYCGNGAVSGITITLQLSADGGQTVVGNALTSTACPTTSPIKVGVLPALKPNPPFLSWGYQPRKMLAVPPGSIGTGGVVNVAGTVVTLQNIQETQELFDVDWTPGTPILIAGTYRHIASMQGATQLTLQENLGTVTGASWSGAAFGVVVTKSSNGNAVDVSLGINAASSSIHYAGSAGSIPTCNPISIDVTKSADGTQTLNPALKGYICYVTAVGGRMGIYLWVPYNADGSVRNDSRYLSYTRKEATSPRFHANGDPLNNAFLLTNIQTEAIYDGVDGKSIYAFDNNSGTGKEHVFKLTYDETLTGCAGYVALTPFPLTGLYSDGSTWADDCFQWTNLSSFALGKDLQTQMVNAYHTGLNTNGDTVGVAHPGVDLGWMSAGDITVSGAGYFGTIMRARQDGICLMAGFRASDLLLTNIADSWSSGDASDVGCHGFIVAEGNYAFLTGHEMSFVGDASAPFYSRFEAAVTRVNRAGFGATAVWDCAGCSGGPNQNTSLAWDEGRTCPSGLPAPFAALSGTANCVQVDVSSPPCNHSPNTTYLFQPSGNSEAVEFPCTMPGFGSSGAWSKLFGKDFAIGDQFNWVAGGVLSDGMVLVAAPTYNSSSSAYLWLLRWAGHHYLTPNLNCCDDKNTGHFVNDPWSIVEYPKYSTPFTSLAFRLDTGNAPPLKDNPGRSSGHASEGPGTTSSKFSWGGAGAGPLGGYGGYKDVTNSGQIFQPFNDVGAYWAFFNNSQNDAVSGYFQSYPSMTYKQGILAPLFLSDARPIAPASGGGEINPAGVGDPINLTLVTGTSKSYRIDDGLAGNSIPLGHVLDYKRLGTVAAAGHFNLKDVSNTSTTNTTDLADWSVCTALQNGECFVGSTKGQRFVTLPMLDSKPTCVVAQHTQVSPCAFQPGSWSGQIIEVALQTNSIAYRQTRKFGFGGSIPGEQNPKCRVGPDGTMILCNEAYPFGGNRADWLAYQIDHPADDPIDRTTFVNTSVSTTGIGGANQVQWRFGYLENGDPATEPRCMPYASACTVPSGSSDPYNFLSGEALSTQACLTGNTCNGAIPALVNRVVYQQPCFYNSGVFVSCNPLSAFVVPGPGPAPSTTIPASALGGKAVLGGQVVVH